jgi:hypothetical protein
MSDGATPGPGSEPQGAAEGDLERERRKELKARRKLRAAWISFVGRIVAQVIGAAATVTLGLLIAHRIHRAEMAPPPPVVATPVPARVPDHGVAIAVLPLDNFSGDPARDARDDRHLWSEVYDRDLRDVLALQSDGARRVSREVRVVLGGPAGSVPADVRAVEGDRPRLAAVGGALPELPQPSTGQR